MAQSKSASIVQDSSHRSSSKKAKSIAFLPSDEEIEDNYSESYSQVQKSNAKQPPIAVEDDL